MKLIRFLILIFAVTLFSHESICQNIHTVEYPNQSDIKVFVVDYPNQSDLNIFLVDYTYQITEENEGLWYFVEYPSQADKKVFFVDYPNQSDLKIYYVKYRNQAGWKNPQKKHLFD